MHGDHGVLDGLFDLAVVVDPFLGDFQAFCEVGTVPGHLFESGSRRLEECLDLVGVYAAEVLFVECLVADI